MMYKEYLMGLIMDNTQTFMTLDAFVNIDRASVYELIRIDYEDAPLDKMEDWLDERNIEYDVWDIRYDTESEVRDAIYDNDDDDIVEAWNQYCSNERYYEDQIHSMWELDEMLDGESPTKIIECTQDLNTNDEWFRCDDYGDYTSSNDYEDLVDIDDLAAYILRTGDNLGLAGLDRE